MSTQPTEPSASILSASVLQIVALGVDMFADEVEQQGASVLRVDWRPPVEVAEDAYRLLGELED